MVGTNKVKVIIDYDGTLTDEEKYVEDLAQKSIKDLANNILHIKQEKLKEIYHKTKKKILKNPHLYSWLVDGLPACYAHEGALLLNTVTNQTLILENKDFKKAVVKFWQNKKTVYGPVVDCTNYLFHKHSFSLAPYFKKKAKEVLTYFIRYKGIEPYILTCSKGDKVAKNLAELGIGSQFYQNGFKDKISIFSDTRQYEMDSSWPHYFYHKQWGRVQKIKVNKKFSIDLRRPDYYKKLKQIKSDGSKIIIAADMVSLPGILPLLMGMDFVLVKAVYTPQWAVDFVKKWPNGWVIDDIAKLPETVNKIMINWFLKVKL